MYIAIHGVAESDTTERLIWSDTSLIPTPVFLPGESQGQRNLVGCHLWGCTESDKTEATWQQHTSLIDYSYNLNKNPLFPCRNRKMIRDNHKPVNPKGDQHWIFIGRTDVEAGAPILWPRDVKSWLIGKDPDAGKDLGQEEKGPTKDKMVWWHHQLNDHKFEQTPGDSGGQGSLMCCNPWGRQVGLDLVPEWQ